MATNNQNLSLRELFDRGALPPGRWENQRIPSDIRYEYAGSRQSPVRSFWAVEASSVATRPPGHGVNVQIGNDAPIFTSAIPVDQELINRVNGPLAPRSPSCVERTYAQCINASLRWEIDGVGFAPLEYLHRQRLVPELDDRIAIPRLANFLHIQNVEIRKVHLRMAIRRHLTKSAETAKRGREARLARQKAAQKAAIKEREELETLALLHACMPHALVLGHFYHANIPIYDLGGEVICKGKYRHSKDPSAPSVKNSYFERRGRYRPLPRPAPAVVPQPVNGNQSRGSSADSGSAQQNRKPEAGCSPAPLFLRRGQRTMSLSTSSQDSASMEVNESVAPNGSLLTLQIRAEGAGPSAPPSSPSVPQTSDQVNSISLTLQIRAEGAGPSAPSSSPSVPQASDQVNSSSSPNLALVREDSAPDAIDLSALPALPDSDSEDSGPSTPQDEGSTNAPDVMIPDDTDLSVGLHGEGLENDLYSA